MGSTDSIRVVRVSQKGQATIPKRLREKYGIDAPGRVRFRETEEGEIVIEPVPRPDEKLGSRSDRVDDGAVAETLDRLREEEEALERRELERHRANEE